MKKKIPQKILTFATSLRPTASAAAAFFWHVSWILLTFRLKEQGSMSDDHLTDPRKAKCLNLSPALTCSSRPGPCGPAAGRRSPGWWLSQLAWWAVCRSQCPPSWPWTDGISDRDNQPKEEGEKKEVAEVVEEDEGEKEERGGRPEGAKNHRIKSGRGRKDFTLSRRAWLMTNTSRSWYRLLMPSL